MPDPREGSPRTTETEALPAYLGLLAVVAYLVIADVVVHALRIVAAAFTSGGGAPTAETGSLAAAEAEPTSLIIYVGPAVAGAILLVLALRWTRGSEGRPARLAMGWRRASTRTSLLALSAGLALSLAAASLHLFAPMPESQRSDYFSYQVPLEGWQRLAWCLYALGAGPLLEEFVFRGVVYGAFVNRGIPGLAGIVSTVGFVWAHIPPTWIYQHPIVLVATVPLVFISIITCALRRRSGSIAPGVAFHTGQNLGLIAGALIFHLMVKGA